MLLTSMEYYGVMIARLFSNNTLINNISSVYECLDAVGTVKETITQDAYKNMYC